MKITWGSKAVLLFAVVLVLFVPSLSRDNDAASHLTCQYLGMVFSSDGTLLAVGDMQGLVVLYDVATGKVLRTLKGSFGAFSPDGKILVSTRRRPSSEDPYETSVYRDETRVSVWSVETGEELRKFDVVEKDRVPMAFSRNGRILAIGDPDDADRYRLITGLRLIDVTTGNELRKIAVRGEIPYIALSEDGRTLLTARKSGAIQLWEVSSGKEVRQFEGQVANVYHAVFSPDNQAIATIERDEGEWEEKTGVFLCCIKYKTVMRLWDAVTGKESRKLEGPLDHVHPVAFSMDSKRLVAAGLGRVHFWDIRSGKKLGEVESPDRGSVFFSPDGQMMATGEDQLRLWTVNMDESKDAAIVKVREASIIVEKRSPCSSPRSEETIKALEKKKQKILEHLKKLQDEKVPEMK